jgi:hypothetical protein
MLKRMSLIGTVMLLALSLSAPTRAEEAPVTEVTVTPSTQPATTVDGVVVQPAPEVKVKSTSSLNPETVAERVKEWAAVLGVVALVLIPAIVLVLNKLGDVKVALTKVATRTDEQDKRLDRQGEMLTRGTGDGNVPPPPGGA